MAVLWTATILSWSTTAIMWRAARKYERAYLTLKKFVEDRYIPVRPPR